MPLATLSANAALADDANDGTAPSGSAYILNLDGLQPSTGDTASELDAWPGFSAVSSPSGVFLPDASAYFDPHGGGEFTFLTPRYQGLQVSWTGDRDVVTGPSSGDGFGAQTYVSHPTSVGASFAEGAEDFEISVGGNYGKATNSVPGAVSLVDDQSLLRVGAHARIREFTLGGAFGSNVDPSNLGDTLSWDAFGRYDFGSLAIGLVYNYTVESDSPSANGGGMPGTLQGGVTYFFTPRMAVTTNLAYGSYVDQGGSDDTGVAGVLGFALDF